MCCSRAYRSIIANDLQAPEHIKRCLKVLAVSWSPCGYKRQLVSEHRLDKVPSATQPGWKASKGDREKGKREGDWEREEKGRLSKNRLLFISVPQIFYIPFPFLTFSPPPPPLFLLLPRRLSLTGRQEVISSHVYRLPKLSGLSKQLS